MRRIRRKGKEMQQKDEHFYQAFSLRIMTYKPVTKQRTLNKLFPGYR
jgi:hypothetical protein